ncbi:MAG TPA: ergothioneine biosynthesis protein EgtB [Methylomirabilota bacterium]|jgi:ergothioneine biosynthesis protein EgtB|nr:ergothioneine biosynthesis protein EgtB [Methylomirabilota bacterium]
MNTDQLLEQYVGVRRLTERLCEPLAVEDYVVQAMPDVSPTKWHLAHVSWFFETFLLRPHLPGYRSLDDRYAILFNSYYNGVGPQFSRPARGHLSRPTVQEVYAYRAHVDKAVVALLEQTRRPDAVASVLELGLHHEQQHQELLVTDLKYNLAVNPLRPPYGATAARETATAPAAARLTFDGGVVEIGDAGGGFAFDNERPRHRVLLAPFALGSRAVTNAEYREFVEDRGYARHELWLSEGWRTVQERGWRAPLYWERVDGAWHAYTLAGFLPLAGDAPVAHVSYYEADAYARWRGARLPTEFEWEHAAASQTATGSLLDDAPAEPAPAPATRGLVQMTGDVWEWTASAYLPYPGFRTLDGALGEYNGKFMVSQMVLRGGSCATPHAHIRRTYRNFFPPDARWQFSGIRLAYEPA